MRLTDRTSLTTAALNDLMHIVDISDKTDSDEGTSKKIRIDDMGFQLYSQRGKANGYTPLNSNVKIDTQYLPSYVDDVLEFTNRAAFPTTGEAGKIYIAKDSNFCYRWSGTVYVQVGGGGSGDVETVFGRMGNIVASQGDYKTSLITNNSNVSGAYLDDALDWLNANKAAYNHTHTFASITSKPTTLSGYGITDTYTKGESLNYFLRKDVSDTFLGANFNLGNVSNQMGQIQKHKGDSGTMSDYFIDDYFVSRRSGGGTVSGWKWNSFDSERMILTTNGNLTLNGNQQIKSGTSGIPTLGEAFNSVLRLHGQSASFGLNITQNGNGHSYIQSQRFDGAATAYPILLNALGGDVGIGITRTPSATLDVGGSGSFSGNVTAGGFIGSGSQLTGVIKHNSSGVNTTTGGSLNTNDGQIYYHSNSSNNYGGTLPSEYGLLYQFQGSTTNRHFSIFHNNNSTDFYLGSWDNNNNPSWDRIYHSRNLRSNSQNDSRYFRSDITDTKNGTANFNGEVNLRNIARFTEDGVRGVSILTNATDGASIGTYTAHDFLLKRGNSTKLTLKGTGVIVNGTLTASNLSGTNTGDQIAGTGLSGTSTLSITNIAAGNNTVGALRYNGNTKSSGRLYGGSSNPSNTTRLNYDGHLYVSELTSIGIITANGFYESSDVRLKENISPLNYGLKEIEKIDTHTWNWKSDGTEDMGVIAQELELIMPELVKKDEEGYKSVNYPKLIPVLINAIKELSNGKK